MYSKINIFDFAVTEQQIGVPWTEDEHKLFLLGLQKVGKGDWRGISRNFVKTRTPTQVASHAQKYFLRRSNLNRRRRRSSLFDITTDSVSVLCVIMSNKSCAYIGFLLHVCNFICHNHHFLLGLKLFEKVFLCVFKVKSNIQEIKQIHVIGVCV